MKVSDNFPKNAIATFAGGCFWCMQYLFDEIDGVQETVVGYIGGSDDTATYSKVCTGKTSHREAIQILYNPAIIHFKELLQLFILNIDPTNNRGQFTDVGPQYRTAVYYHDEFQKKTAEEFFHEILIKGKQKVIHTEILPAQKFFPAETYHQHYSETNPIEYHRYYQACGRLQRLKQLWGD